MKRVSGYLICLTLIIGALTVVGWWLDIEILKHPVRNNDAMNPVTGVSIVAASISFLLMYQANPGKVQFAIARLLAGFVLIVGALKLWAITGIDTGINYWLFRNDVIADQGSILASDALTVINSSYGFLITGISLLLNRRADKRAGLVISYLALSGFIIGTFVCIGFIYHVDEFYGLLPHLSVAPATGICFTLFSLAMLFGNSGSGFMAVISSKNLGGIIARRLTPVGIGVPFVFGYIWLYLASRFQFSLALGDAVLTVSIVVVFLVVLWFLARALNQSDAERKEANQRLERQALLFNILPDAVIYGNKDLSIIQMNPAAKSIFEVKDETGPFKLDDLFTIEMTPVARDAVRKDLWGEKGSWRGESNLITRTGKRIQTMALLQSVKNERGENEAWFGVYTDISFLRLNEELKEANSYLEQLAFISAHDIKSPILSLQGLADLLGRPENINGEGIKILDMQKNVIRQMQRTNNALNEILKLRQNLRVKDAVERETLTVEKISGNIVALLETELARYQARLIVQVDDIPGLELPSVYFQSLFYNLIYNSLKYNDPTRPLVISFTGRRINPETVRFIIEDNGLGFDIENNRHRLFGIFKRFHNHVEGTGIGLHIVKSIVDAFHGEIEVFSQQGKGTRFDLTFKTENLS